MGRRSFDCDAGWMRGVGLGGAINSETTHEVIWPPSSWGGLRRAKGVTGISVCSVEDS